MFEQKKFLSQKMPGEYLGYVEYLPPAQKGKLPLVIYTHGAGSRGEDLSKLKGGPIRAVREGRKLEAILVAPQCRYETWFDTFPVLCEFIEAQKNRPEVDPSRVYLIGNSMGGYTAWQLCISHPDWFAAAVPICGGGMYWDAPRLKDLPIWAFHGARDQEVLPEESVKMVEAINNHGGNARLTIFPDTSHNAWDPALEMDELWAWLFEQKK